MEDGEPGDRVDELAQLTIIGLLKKIEQLKTTQLDSRQTQISLSHKHQLYLFNLIV